MLIKFKLYITIYTIYNFLFFFLLTKYILDKQDGQNLDRFKFVD